MLKFRQYVLLSLLCIFGVSSAIAQSKPAYQLYRANAKKVSYNKMLRQLGKAEVVLFGELHNNPIAHWLEFELAADLYKTQDIQLGAEMLEADNQTSLDAYLEASIDEKEFKERTRLWQNYATDYAALVKWAKEHKVPFTATNIPRRFANLVFKEGFEALENLTALEKTWIATLPIPFDPELETYQDILKMLGDHASPLLVKAQAIKDATMAHFILKNKEANTLFLHFNGSFHSDKYQGIVWYLHTYADGLQIKTITTVEQASLKKLEKQHINKADFILVVPETMTKTY